MKSNNVDKPSEMHYPRHDRLEGKTVSAVEELDELLTVQEVCELLKVSKSYIYWLKYERKIPFIKMQGHLRFRKSAIDEWLRSQEVRIGRT